MDIPDIPEPSMIRSSAFAFAVTAELPEKRCSGPPGDEVPIPTLLPLTNKVLLIINLVAFIEVAFIEQETPTLPTTVKALYGEAVPIPTLSVAVVSLTEVPSSVQPAA